MTINGANARHVTKKDLTPLFSEVTKSGYRKHLGWHELTAGSEVYLVELEVAPAAAAAPPAERQPTRQGYEPEMVAIRGGCYKMGSPASEKDS